MTQRNNSLSIKKVLVSYVLALKKYSDGAVLELGIYCRYTRASTRAQHDEDSQLWYPGYPRVQTRLYTYTRYFSGLCSCHDPSPRVGSGIFRNFTGWVGSCRVGSGRVESISNYLGPSSFTVSRPPPRPDPQGLTRPVKKTCMFSSYMPLSCTMFPQNAGAVPAEF